MSYSLEQISLATCLVRVLVIILIVGLVAFIAKSRLLFLGGALGSLSGFVIPQPQIYRICFDGVAAFMMGIEDAADHVLACGMVGAFAGAAIRFALGRWRCPVGGQR
jgi:hypothetical protein